MGILKKTILKKSVSAMLPMLALAGIGLSPASASASTIGLPDVSSPRANFGRPEDVPPINPPFDTPGRENAPVIPAVVPDYTFPGSNFGQAAVPVPAAAWLFGSGLLGLVGIARRKKAV